MKESKREIKYIIRRILIGVGIAIILFNLKKCNVYALDRYSYVLPQRSGAIQLYDTEQNAIYIPNVGTKATINNLNVVDSSLANETTIHFGTDSTVGTYSSSSSTLLHFIYNNEFEVFIQILLNPSSTTYTKLSSGDYSLLLVNDGSSVNGNTTDYLQVYLVPTTDIDKSLSQISDKTKITSSTNITYINMDSALSSSHCPLPNVSNVCSNVNTATSTDANGDTIYFGNQVASSSNINKNLLDPSKIEILENKNNWYAYNGVTLEPDNDPLANYTKVDMTGKQALLLVPKNYQTMLSDSSHTIESAPGVFRTYLDLEYYSQECVRGTLINVEDAEDIMMNNIGVGTGNLAESISGTCYSEPTQTIMSYEYDQYSGLISRGLLIYNATTDWNSDFGNETPFFGPSYVWYDPTMYNAYPVISFDEFNQTIQYKDYAGEDQEVTIESLPTFQEAMENAVDNVDSPTQTDVNKAKLQAIFGFLKTPFAFLNKLNTTSCSAINLPFPRSNQNIHLECLSSSVYDRYLPDALKSIIVIIINGLLFYRCTLSNIDIFTDILDPEDNKLEAVQL